MSLRIRIVAAIAGLILVLGVGGTLHARLTLASFAQAEMERRSLALTRDLESNAGELLLSNDIYGLYARLNDVVLTNEDVRYIVILDNNGEIKASTFPGVLPAGLRTANSVAAGAPYSLRSISTSEGKVLDAAYPVVGAPGITIRLGLSEARLGGEVASLTLTLLLLTAGVLAAGLLVGYLLATYLTRPLSRLAEAARAVGRGELSQQLEVSSQGEVAQVTEAFNAMTARLREKEEERRQLVMRTMAAQEDERKRIARELHDEAGQALTSLLLGLKHLEDGLASSAHKAEAAQLRSLTTATLDLMREIALELRPSSLDDLGLVAALRRYATEYGGKHGLDVDFHAGSVDGARLSAQAETALYRIAQEALTNVARHADAQSVSVLLDRRNGNAILVVEDDGGGFDPELVWRARGPSGRLGIMGMEERASLVGGNLTIESRPGVGTAVFAEVPWEEQSDGPDPDTHR
jgi:signal transduction histidine kinase